MVPIRTATRAGAGWLCQGRCRGSPVARERLVMWSPSRGGCCTISRTPSPGYTRERWDTSQFDGHAATAKENNPLNEQTEKSAHIKQTNYQLKLFLHVKLFRLPMYSHLCAITKMKSYRLCANRKNFFNVENQLCSRRHTLLFSYIPGKKTACMFWVYYFCSVNLLKCQPELFWAVHVKNMLSISSSTRTL